MMSAVPLRPPAPDPVHPWALLFDPDRPWSEAIGGALRERGFRAVPAATLQEARWRLREGRPDLLILSTAVGNLSLESFLAELNRHGVPPPVLLIEDHRGGGCPETWRFLRAARTLRRPCRVRDVADAAWSLIGRTGKERPAGA